MKMHKVKALLPIFKENGTVIRDVRTRTLMNARVRVGNNMIWLFAKKKQLST